MAMPIPPTATTDDTRHQPSSSSSPLVSACLSSAAGRHSPSRSSLAAAVKLGSRNCLEAIRSAERVRQPDVAGDD